MAKKFLPNTSLEYLYKVKETENDEKAKKRILACIFRKKGRTIMEISENLDEPYTTIQNWLARIQKNGIRDRYDIKNEGVKCYLNKKQIRELIRDMKKGPEALGYKSGLWTMPLVKIHIKEKFGVDYNVVSVWYLIKRLGFRNVKPRPINPKAATPEEIEAFKKRAHEKVVRWARKGYTPMCMDATHKMIRSMPTRGWFMEKDPVCEMYKPRQEKITSTVLGAIGPDNKYLFEFYDAGNWDNVKDFLTKVNKKFGPVLMFMDNARYHRKSELTKMTKETKGEMQFDFFLPYTPELNQSETQWREFKQKIAGANIQTEKDLIDFITKGIKQKSINIVKPHDYMTPPKPKK